MSMIKQKASAFVTVAKNGLDSSPQNDQYFANAGVGIVSASTLHLFI